MIKQNILKQLKRVLYILIPLIGGGLVGVSCSEEDNTVDEYANWQERNEAFIVSLATDSLLSPNSNPQWTRIKSYSLDEAVEGNPSDYIYVKIISKGTGTESPMYTDSVRVSYEGRLIPTDSYPLGYVFDTTAGSTYDPATNATVKFQMVTSGGVENLVSGWITALMHMHRGDHWRIFIPYQLGYGNTDKSTSGIPPYSTLIFDLTLVDFAPAGHAMDVWSSRQLKP